MLLLGKVESRMMEPSSTSAEIGSENRRQAAPWQHGGSR
jgi:hypothetical protein